MHLKTTIASVAAALCWTAVPVCAQVPPAAPGAGAPWSAQDWMRKDLRTMMADFTQVLLIEKKPRDAYQKYADPQMIQRNPAMGKDRESTIQFLEQMFANPEARFEVQDVYVDGGTTMVSYHGKLGKGLPSARVVEFFRWRDGKIIEHWDVFQVMQP